MDYKTPTRQAYDRTVDDYEHRTTPYLYEFILGEAHLFLSMLPGPNILDLGSGPGRDAQFFQAEGFNPICADISFAMCERCESKGLPTVTADFEKLPFRNNSFDGVWAYTSLLHVPKSNIEAVLRNVRDLLRKDGKLLLGMSEGDFEGFREGSNVPDEKRFFSFYPRQELEDILLRTGFSIVHFSTTQPTEECTILNYILRV